MPDRGRRWVVGVVAAVIPLAAPGARAATIGGVVRAAGQPLAGVFVAATGPAGTAAGLTGPGGVYSLTVPPGTFQVTADTPGYATAVLGGVAVTGEASADLTLVPSGTAVTSAPIFGGGSLVAADGTPGVFYAAGSDPGQLYRSVDWGGTWTQVDLSIDDPVAGLPETGVVDNLVTSGFPGEVAVLLSTGQVYDSSDYGATWSAVAGVPAYASNLAWGHAGSTNVMLADDGVSTYVADMTSPLPTFAKMTSPYPIADGFAVADGASGPWIATLDERGDVSIYPLVAGLVAPSPATTVSGFPTGNVDAIAFGGASSGTAPPSSIVVSGPYVVGMSVAARGSAAYPAPATVQTNCDGTRSTSAFPDFGSDAITPNSAGAYGAAWVNGCWLQDLGGQLTTPVPVGGYEAAIDSGYDATESASGSDAVVMLAPQPGEASAELNVEKLSASDAGDPESPPDPTATAAPGPGPSTGGLSADGLTAVTVLQSTLGPAPTDTATATTLGGVASADGGATFDAVSSGYADATAWWTGASGNWLMFGVASSSADHDMAAAVKDWSPGVAPTAGGNVDGSDATALGTQGLPGSNPLIDSIAGVPGSDEAFVGTAVGPLGSGCTCDDGTVWRVGITDGPSFTGATQIGAGQIVKSGPVAYCPVAGSAPSIADVLVVVAEDAFGGGLFRVSGAAGADPTVTEVRPLTGFGPGGLPALSVDCANGEVVAASGETGDGVLVSTDGGQTFADLPVPEPAGGPVTLRAVALGPGALTPVILVGDADGYIERSDDGGLTWTVVNNPNFGVNLSATDAAGIDDLLSVTSAIGLAADRALAVPASSIAIIDGPGELVGRLRAATPPPAPRIDRFAFIPARFSVARSVLAELGARRSRGPRPMTGSSLRFTLTDRGAVVISFYRVLPGRRRGRGCVAGSGRGRRCTAYRQVRAILVRRALAGVNAIRFTGRIGHVRFAPGTYVAAIADQTPVGRMAVPRLARFTILSAPKSRAGRRRDSRAPS